MANIYFFEHGEEGTESSTKLIDSLGEDNLIELLGNKGAQLQVMTSMDLPVPPGFTITTDVCEYYFRNNDQLPGDLMPEVRTNISRLEQTVTKLSEYSELSERGRLGDTKKDPLLVSVRSGAAASMPGMMETILNVGLNDESVEAYIERHSDDEQAARFILDCQRRLYEMYGENVFGIKKDEFGTRLNSLRKEYGLEPKDKLEVDHLRELVTRYKGIFQSFGKELPQDPYEQLEAAIEAIERSAMGEKARDFRRAEGLPEEVFTAVNVQTMVYGNKNMNSCAGVGFTRDRQTGVKDHSNLYGEFTFGQGEDVVNGAGEEYFKLSKLKDKGLSSVYSGLIEICDLLEEKTGRVQDYEFTVEDGKLWMLQTRNGKMTGRGNVRSSYDMVMEKGITLDEISKLSHEKLAYLTDAILRVSPNDIEQLLHPMIDYDAVDEQTGKTLKKILSEVYINPKKGSGASPGGGVGQVVFDQETAIEYSEKGIPVVLCRVETNPADFSGMIVSKAIVTEKGGETSHAALVAGNKGIPCVVGTGINIDETKKQLTYTNEDGKTVTVKEGDIISADGSKGRVLHYEAGLTKPGADDPDLKDFLDMLKPVAKMRVYANANDADEARTALQFGAEGIGLARTEYMFLEDKVKGEDRALTIQSWILAEDESVKSAALEKLRVMQENDFLAMYKVMQHRPIIIRLLDYPLHELLGDAKDHLGELSKLTNIDPDQLEQVIDSYRENNSMLGHRSVRLGITHPKLYRMQVRAILTAAKEYNKQAEGNYATPHIEIPLVSMPTEVQEIEKIVEEEAEKLEFTRGVHSSQDGNGYLLGVMYELAGASFNADVLTEVSDFGSFGTNDLTQSTMGWSREDGKTTIMPVYRKKKIVKEDPFKTIDKDGSVAKAMYHGVLLARSVNSDYDFGICGGHAGDPDSLKVCYGAGLTNVSPGPRQVPIAWLVSAQLSLTKEYGGMLDEYAEKIRNQCDLLKNNFKNNKQLTNYR